VGHQLMPMLTESPAAYQRAGAYLELGLAWAQVGEAARAEELLGRCLNLATSMAYHELVLRAEQARARLTPAQCVPNVPHVWAPSLHTVVGEVAALPSVEALFATAH